MRTINVDLKAKNKKLRRVRSKHNNKIEILKKTDNYKSKKKSSEKDSLRRKKLPKRLSHKSKNKKKSLSKLVSLIVAFGIVGLGVFGYYRLQALNARRDTHDENGEKIECTNILNPDCWTDVFTPQLKQTDGFTNALIVGIDTREAGVSGSGLMNTDTMIFASFNHETEETMLISIPRDFYVNEYSTRLNSVYAFTYKINDEDPYFYLKEMFAKILGKPVHYMVEVRMSGVEDAINDIGGIEICPETYVKARYPEPGKGWKNYEFDKGCQEIDGKQALVWARFRKVSRGDTRYASDFSRNRRQQEIIESVKDKMLAQEMSVQERAETYLDLVDTYKDTVSVEIGLEDILAGLAYIDSANRDPINVVLDPNFGGINKYIYTPVNNGFYHIKARDTSYKKIQAELDNIWDWSAFYKDRPTIAVQNMTGEDLTDDHLMNQLYEEARFTDGIFINNVNQTDKFTGIKIFDLSDGNMSNSTKYLLNYLGVESLETFPPEEFGQTQTSRKEDILILIGPEILQSNTIEN